MKKLKRPSESRSLLMSKIKSKGTQPEILLRKSLWIAGVRFRTNNKDLPGTPDISIKKYKIAVFVDGEFWHGYNWENNKKKIKTNSDYWIPKIERNIKRDIESNHKLLDMGYTVLRFWANDVIKRLGHCTKLVIDAIYNNKFNGFEI